MAKTKDTGTVTRQATTTVGFRLRDDLVPLLDSLAKRRGHPDRATLLREVATRELEAAFPGCTGEAA